MLLKVSIFTIFFFLVYLEPLSIGPVKISLLWKAFFLTFIFVYSIRSLVISKLNAYSYLYCIKHVFSIGAISSFFESLMELVKTATIPFLLHFFSTLAIEKPNSIRVIINKCLVFICISLILFNIPFLFGVLPELSSGIALTALGGDELGYSGPFQNGHAASITMGACGLVMLYLSIAEVFKVKRYLYILLMFLSMIVVFKTLVRTGFIMMFFGMLTYIYTYYGYRRFLKFIPAILILLVLSFIYISSNEELMLRMFDGSVYEREYEHWFYNIGSGRLWMAWTNIVFLWESGFLSWVLGTGIGPSKDNMELVVGIRVFSHNGFVDALTHNGLIGFFLYVMVLYQSFKLIADNKNKDKNKYSLAVALFLSYLLFVLFQGGSRFYLDVIYILTLVQLKYARN